jgi:hypothetical protein
MFGRMNFGCGLFFVYPFFIFACLVGYLAWERRFSSPVRLTLLICNSDDLSEAAQASKLSGPAASMLLARSAHLMHIQPRQGWEVAITTAAEEPHCGTFDVCCWG